MAKRKKTVLRPRCVCGAWPAHDGLNPAHIRRDHLLSEMLQDRAVVRLLSAPHGFGKTSLASEYASRLFQADEVCWVDASTPDFITLLDRPGALDTLVFDREKLVVCDCLPYLDEGRSDELLLAIERLLARGVEVIVTTVPSHDCVRCRSPQRILLRATDLLVDKRECLPASTAKGSESSARANQEWARASQRFFGRVPSVFWGRGAVEIESCLDVLFSEKLPSDLFKAMFGMFLVGSGFLHDLDSIGCPLPHDCERMLVEEYPVFGLDLVRRRFEVPRFAVLELRGALEHQGLETMLVFGPRPAPYLAARQLSMRGDFARALEILEVFCTDEQCVSWLRERGWEHLDCGAYHVAERLLARCEAAGMHLDSDLVAFKAWCRGLQGDFRQARHFARAAQRAARMIPAEEGFGADAALSAHLALLAFDAARLLAPDETKFSSMSFSSMDMALIAEVVDACTGVELRRALTAAGSELAEGLQVEREDVSQERAERLRAIMTNAAGRLPGGVLYRLALHILNYVDDAELHRLACDLGQDELLALQEGVQCTLTQAVLIRDLWSAGCFGASAGIAGASRHVDRLLERAARALEDHASIAATHEAYVPWKMSNRHAVSRAVAAGAQDDGAGEAVHIVNVRMFGGFGVTVGSRTVSDAQWRRKSRTLFMMLVMQQGRDLSRDEVLEQLWPSVSRPKALDSFYSVWSNMNSVLGEGPYLERSGDFLRINPRYVISDVMEFERLFRSLLVDNRDVQELLDTYARIERVYGGGLLPTERNVPAVGSARERYKAMYVDSMVAATARALDAGDTRVALWFARKGLEAEQQREDVYGALMRAQIAAGQRCSAIRTYFSCRDFLREEMGLDPSAELQELYESLIVLDPSLAKLDSALLA